MDQSKNKDKLELNVVRQTIKRLSGCNHMVQMMLLHNVN